MNMAQQARVMVAADRDARPAPKEVFAAWRLSPDNPRAEAIPCTIGEVRTLDEAVSAALVGNALQHKDALVVLVTDTVSKKRMAHFYAIKQDTKAPYVFDKEKGKAVKAKRFYPAALFSMAVSEFSPVEPFRWSPGADVVGADRDMIEGRAR